MRTLPPAQSFAVRLSLLILRRTTYAWFTAINFHLPACLHASESVLDLRCNLARSSGSSESCYIEPTSTDYGLQSSGSIASGIDQQPCIAVPSVQLTVRQGLALLVESLRSSFLVRSGPTIGNNSLTLLPQAKYRKSAETSYRIYPLSANTLRPRMTYHPRTTLSR